MQHLNQKQFIPQFFMNRALWVLWRLEPNSKGKLTKVPYSATGGYGSSTNRDTWSTYAAAHEAFEKAKASNRPYSGLGVVLSKDLNITFIDIDHCFSKNGEMSETAKDILAAFPKTYAEISQSGSGLHIFALGTIPRDFKNSKTGVEMYTTGRYCCLTSNSVQPYEPAEYQSELTEVYEKYKTKQSQKHDSMEITMHPISFASDQEILDKALKNKKFSDCYSGQWQEHFPSQSEADLYLCTQLAFWCERDAEAVDRIFRSSALYRPKWDTLHGEKTYGEMTTAKACKELDRSFTEWRQQQNQTAQYDAVTQTKEYWNSLMQTAPVQHVGRWVIKSEDRFSPEMAWEEEYLQTESPVSAEPVTGSAQKNEVNDLDIPTLADFEEKEVDWLIRGYIPKGNITILAGTGGTGKSSVWASLLAAVSSGKPSILEGTAGIEREPKKVMFFTSEDAISEVVKAKARKNHAVQENIVLLDPTDDRFNKIEIGGEYLERLIAYHKPALCLFDPLQRFINSKLRMAERNAMRHALDSLQRLGMKYGTAFIILMHTNKQSGVYGRQRIADSSDMWDIARSVLMIGETGEDNLRYISHEKSNYSKLSRTVIFDIVDSVPVFKEWSDKKDRDFILSALQVKNNNGIDYVQECANVILSELADAEKKTGDGIAVPDMDDLLNGMGYSDRNIRAAKHNLQESGFIQYERSGFGGGVKMYRNHENKD